MRMDLIQPFIGSLDAVLAEMMKEPWIPPSRWISGGCSREYLYFG